MRTPTPKSGVQAPFILRLQPSYSRLLVDLDELSGTAAVTRGDVGFAT